MATDGSVQFHYEDDLVCFGKLLGRLDVRRVTHIEWDGEVQKWKIVDNEGEALAFGSDREALRALERQFVDELGFTASKL